MIKRYQTPEMARIWEENSKFQFWLELELAVLTSRVTLGRLPVEIFARIQQQAKFDVARIEEIDRQIEHDLLAFVQCVRENLEPELHRYFHEGLTSYDAQEIPMNLRLRASLQVLLKEVAALKEIIRAKAVLYRDAKMIGRTHGQHAKPITFGLKLLGWLDMFMRDEERLQAAAEAISYGKLSGAVGTYSDLVDPALEEVVCKHFQLKPVNHSTQIIHRDRIAQVMEALALLACDIDHVATEIRRLAQTEIAEVFEPILAKQKGSSAMPHKRNPVICERICGQARILRGSLVVALENVITWSERDISQSSAERVILPDSFHLMHYMFKKLIWIIDGLEVRPEKMLENLRLTQGCIFSEDVKNLMCSYGIDPEVVYYLLRDSAFEALEKKKPYFDVILERGSEHFTAPDRVEALRSCFDEDQCLEYVGEIFARFGL